MASSLVEQLLVPPVKPGDVVALDNLSAHKVPRIAKAIQATAKNCFNPGNR
jgi:hypothetical protein